MAKMLLDEAKADELIQQLTNATNGLVREQKVQVAIRKWSDGTTRLELAIVENDKEVESKHPVVVKRTA